MKTRIVSYGDDRWAGQIYKDDHWYQVGRDGYQWYSDAFFLVRGVFDTREDAVENLRLHLDGPKPVCVEEFDSLEELRAA